MFRYVRLVRVGISPVPCLKKVCSCFGFLGLGLGLRLIRSVPHGLGGLAIEASLLKFLPQGFRVEKGLGVSKGLGVWHSRTARMLLYGIVSSDRRRAFQSTA